MNIDLDNKQVYIFDLDGTLVNSLDDLAVATNVALEKCGYPTRSVEEIRTFVGGGITVLLELALPEEKEVSESEFKDLEEVFYDYYYTHLWDYSEPYEGIREVLDLLQKEDKQLYVLTNKEEKSSKAIIKHFFEDTFIEVSGAREDKKLKPAPDELLRLVKQSGKDLDEVVMLGDTDSDIKVAQNAKVDVIACAWGFRSKENLESYNPDVILDSPKELLDLLK